MALKNGYTSAAVADAAIGGVTTAMSAIFILLAVGALIGTWNMAGTIPTIVDYGVQLLNPTIFYVTTAAICALVGMVTGSSWTTAGTLGVAFAAIDTLFSRGGMASLLTTIWLVLAALSFAAIMEHAGFLERLLPQVLARAVEDSGTVTSVLVPWNTCDAYISGVLGVSTAAYFPYCVFNFVSPILDVLYGFIGFKVPTAPPEAEPREVEEPLEVDDAPVTPLSGA